MFEFSPQDAIEKVKDETLSSFQYLKQANECLSSPRHKSIGREYVIRALDELSRFEKHSKILRNLVRKAGLYPYLKKYFPDKKPEIDLLLSLYKSETNPDFTFHSMQAKIYNLLVSGKNVVLSAPTSMGKSAIVDSLIGSNIFSRMVVVVPTIALIDETRRRIQNSFGRSFQIIHHGSQERRKSKVIYILTQERVNERDDLENIDIFVVDEFYKLAFGKDDNSRVVALNIALSKLLIVSKQFYMIGPYIDAIRGIETLTEQYVFVPSEFNTVALNVHNFNLKANDTNSKNTKLKEILHQNSGQTIIYCRSQNSINQVVTSLNYLEFKDPSDEILIYQEWLERFYGESWCYSRALKIGVGVHHGTLPRALQQKTVELFNRGELRLLVCTSTLIEGVNTVAENIVIYDNRRATFSIDNFTFKNISGRAGRMNKHLIGNVFCMESPPEQEFQSNVVDLPLGQQDDDTPLNLVAGIQGEHLSEISSRSLIRYNESSEVPLDVIRNHSSYDVDRIIEGYSLVSGFSISDIISASSQNMPDKHHMSLIAKFIKVMEFHSLRRLSLHFEDDKDLQNRMSWYIYAESHTSYISKMLKYIYKNNEGIETFSIKTDKEFKIARNLFKHAIPRALMLFQDLLNLKSAELGIESEADYGFLVHLFENSHLPSVFSALEEMGVAIETLEKLVTDSLGESNIETVSRYLRIHYRSCEKLDGIDKMFIKLALA